MKRLLPLLSVFAFMGCAKYYTYNFAMTYPKENTKLQYENDTMSVSFNPTTKGIEMDIFNKTNEGMKIEWDEISISVNGKTYRVLHGDATLANITIAQPPSTIPPKSLLTDKIYPVNNVKSIKLNSQLYAVLTDLLPNNDYGNKKDIKAMMDKKGTRIVMYIPYYLSNKFISAYYNIDIVDIVKKK